MPIKIDSNLPAHKLLENENIFVMTEERAVSQDTPAENTYSQSYADKSRDGDANIAPTEQFADSGRG